ncbi:MAG: hypothetical protein KAT88_00480 [Spirochaetes bacterium]|nr:hypothetical protein [Spirochaetota bacterium]
MKRGKLISILVVVTLMLIPLAGVFAGGGKKAAIEEPEPEITIEVKGSQADRAVAIGKQFKGTTLTLLYEGIQAGAIKLFAPNWEKLTGISYSRGAGNEGLHGCPVPHRGSRNRVVGILQFLPVV